MSDVILQAGRNVRLYPWYRFLTNLIFWQAVWFLYVQSELSAAEAILLYAIYDISTTAMEVPSGYMSDRLGRKLTLIASVLTGAAGVALFAIGGGFWVFALAQVLIGASIAFTSGTDSALLYESLAIAGRSDEIEAQELRAWRFSFAGLAISAVLGGAIALTSFVWVYWLTALAFVVAFFLVLGFWEPRKPSEDSDEKFTLRSELTRLKSLKAYLTQPALIWLFALSVLMYGFSHIPFVFGQPFIQQVLVPFELSSETPLISGFVSAMMMILSLVVSLGALRLKRMIGLPAILLLAFGMQIAIIAALSFLASAAAIVFLLLRMVPSSISRPFVLAHIQPLLADDTRATYLSMQSFLGRILFALTLYFASFATSDSATMSLPELQTVLGAYAVIGLVFMIGLGVTVKSALSSRP